MTLSSALAKCAAGAGFRPESCDPDIESAAAFLRKMVALRRPQSPADEFCSELQAFCRSPCAKASLQKLRTERISDLWDHSPPDGPGRPLWQAVLRNAPDPDPALIFLAKAGFIDPGQTEDAHGMNLLSFCAFDHPRCAIELFELGLRPSASDSAGDTPFHHFCYREWTSERQALARLFLPLGPLNAPNLAGLTPFACAAEFGSPEYARWLAEQGAASGSQAFLRKQILILRERQIHGLADYLEAQALARAEQKALRAAGKAALGRPSIAKQL